MSQTTKIEWADRTGGPFMICGEVSPGCANCYAREFMERRLFPVIRRAYEKAKLPDWQTRPVWGRKAPRVLTKSFFIEARRTQKKFSVSGEVCDWFPSMIDWLDEMPSGIIDQDGNWLTRTGVLGDFLNVVRLTPNIRWLLLSKRPENWRVLVQETCDALAEYESEEMRETSAWLAKWLTGTPPDNVVLGITVEDGPRMRQRMDTFIETPARWRMLSCEPLLSDLDLSPWVYRSGCQPHCGEDCSKDADCPLEPSGKIHWIICGGESGKKARPMHPDWARGLRDIAVDAGIAFMFKQWGEWCPAHFDIGFSGRCIILSHEGLDLSDLPINLTPPRAFPMIRLGKAKSGRLLDGILHDDVPGFSVGDLTNQIQ